MFLPWLSIGIMAVTNQKDSYALRCRAQCRLLAVACWAGFAGDDIYAVFPSVVGTLKMLRILVGVKDSVSLIVFIGKGMCRAVVLVTLHPALCSLG